jgi:type II secretory pathway component PulC
VFKPMLFSAGSPVLPRVSILAAAVLTVLIAFGWQVAGFIFIQRGDFIDESRLRLRVSSAQESGMGLEQVAALHLFGDVVANVVAPPPLTELPKTDLKLVLVGAMTNSDPQKASALISADNQTRRFYIGDSIPGGAVLHEVLSDSVVLKREDRFETLFFPKVSDTGAPIKFKAGTSRPLGTSVSTGAVNPVGVGNEVSGRQPKEPRGQLHESLQRGARASLPRSDRQ